MRREVGGTGQCYEQVKGLAVHSLNDVIVHSNVWEVQGAGKWQRRNINFNRSLLPAEVIRIHTPRCPPERVVSLNET